MRVQVLIAAMNQQNHDLLQKMNIQSDAIVGNQCSTDSVDRFFYNGHAIMYLNFNERGVGLNRNNALMRASGDICLFADDDMRYVDNYVNIITEAFQEHPKADVIIFNVLGRSLIKKEHRVHYLNYLRYGTARIAIRLSRVKQKGIYFNQCFGGGTEHCHGEDNLFLTSCLKNGLRILALPIMVAELKDERESTWNSGDTDKYLHDQGILYKTISTRFWKLLCIQDAFRRRKAYKRNFVEIYKRMVKTNEE